MSNGVAEISSRSDGFMADPPCNRLDRQGGDFPRPVFAGPSGGLDPPFLREEVQERNEEA